MMLLPEEAKTLRVFITGGEMLRAETVEHWGDSDVLFNFYGQYNRAVLSNFSSC